MAQFEHIGLFELEEYNQREMTDRQQADLFRFIAIASDMTVNQLNTIQNQTQYSPTYQKGYAHPPNKNPHQHTHTRQTMNRRAKYARCAWKWKILRWHVITPTTPAASLGATCLRTHGPVGAAGAQWLDGLDNQMAKIRLVTMMYHDDNVVWWCIFDDDVLSWWLQPLRQLLPTVLFPALV